MTTVPRCTCCTVWIRLQRSQIKSCIIISLRTHCCKYSICRIIGTNNIKNFPVNRHLMQAYGVFFPCSEYCKSLMRSDLFAITSGTVLLLSLACTSSDFPNDPKPPKGRFCTKLDNPKFGKFSCGGKITAVALYHLGKREPRPFC